MGRVSVWPVVVVLVMAALVRETCAFELFCGKENCFKILGLTREAADTKAVKKAYRNLSLELHPDRNPSENAAKQFNRVANAYEILSDEKKRAEYEDFLDHPEKYYWYYLEHMSEQYAVQADARVVLLGMLLVFTALHFFNMKMTYKSAIRRAKDSVHFKDKVVALMKSGEASTIEEAEDMIDLDLVGYKDPTWRDSLPIVLVKLPFRIAKFIYGVIRWQMRYRVMKKEYTDDDKIYLIREAFRFDDITWERFTDEEKEEMKTRRVWEEKEREQYMQEKRIELNRSGKRGAKRRAKKFKSAPVEDYY